MRTPPQPPLQVWTSFPPETHQQLAKLWTELLRRRVHLPGTAKSGAADECCAVAEPKAATPPSALAGHCLCPAVDAASGAREPGKHATAIPTDRACETHGLAVAAGSGRR